MFTIKTTADALLRAAGVKNPEVTVEKTGAEPDTGARLKLYSNGKMAIKWFTRHQVEDCHNRVNDIAVLRKIDDAVNQVQ